MAQIATNSMMRMGNDCAQNDYAGYDDDEDFDMDQMNYDEQSNNQTDCFYDEESTNNQQQTNDIDPNTSKARPYADKPSSHLKDLYGYVSRRVGEEITKGFECKLCSQIFDITRDILIHLNEVHGENIKIFVCEMCPFASAYRPSVRRHRMEAHKLDGSGTPQLNPSSTSNNVNRTDPAAIRQITNQPQQQQHTTITPANQMTSKTYECKICNFKCHEFIFWKRHRRSARHKLLKSQLEFGQPTENMNQPQQQQPQFSNRNSNLSTQQPQHYQPHHHQQHQQMNPLKSNEMSRRPTIDLRDPYDTKMLMLGEILIDFQDLKTQMNRLHSDFNNMDAHVYNLDERVNNIDSRLARVEDSLDSVLKYFENKVTNL